MYGGDDGNKHIPSVTAFLLDFCRSTDRFRPQSLNWIFHTCFASTYLTYLTQERHAMTIETRITRRHILKTTIGRCLLTIAVTGPEGGLFRRIFKLRHQQWPRRRLFGNAVGKPTEWSYPTAIEHNGNLYITYTQGKEDCVLSIVPIEVLTV